VRAGHAEATLSGTVGDAAAIEAAAARVQDDIDPPSDIHATSAYRRQLATVLTRRALHSAVARAGAAIR
jgi:CO/xanthine dehydrogenase FAD-binding subunit